MTEDGAGVDVELERQLLREFFTSWSFFHAIRIKPSASESWKETQLKLAAQGMVDAANKVAAYDVRVSATKH